MERPTIVLLPGLLCDHAVWSAQAEALAGAGWRVVVPSYGTLDALPAMAQSVLQGELASRFTLVGHSMGARVAMEIMRIAPQRVSALALMDTGLDARPDGAAGQAEEDKRHALLQLARERGMRAMGLQWAPGMLHARHREAPVFDQVLAMIERQTPQTFAAQIRALLARPDTHALFAGIRCPTLIACGRQDAWTPLERHERMQALLPHSTLAVIDDAGHMAPMEQPAAVAQALLGWLRRL